MSYTEIYGVPEVGGMSMIGEVHNAHRGAMAIWEAIAQTYCGMDHFPISGDAMPVWNMWMDETVPFEHRVVLASTFDSVMVRRDHIPELIRCMGAFDAAFQGRTNLPDQMVILGVAADDSRWVAVAWNQTSVNEAWWIPSDHPDAARPFDLSRDAADRMTNGTRAAWLVISDGHVNVIDISLMLDPDTDVPWEAHHDRLVSYRNQLEILMREASET